MCNDSYCKWVVSHTAQGQIDLGVLMMKSLTVCLPGDVSSDIWIKLCILSISKGLTDTQLCHGSFRGGSSAVFVSVV